MFSPEEVERLVAAASARSTTDIRARAIILTLHRGGLRIGETLAQFFVIGWRGSASWRQVL